MVRTFIEMPIFRKKWKELGLDDVDLLRLQQELLCYPKVGDVIQGTGGIRKMRFAFEHRGKSGSIRVIYVDFEVYERIFLITAYAKNEQENLSTSDRADLRHMIRILEDQLAEKYDKGE